MQGSGRDWIFGGVVTGFYFWDPKTLPAGWIFSTPSEKSCPPDWFLALTRNKNPVTTPAAKNSSHDPPPAGPTKKESSHGPARPGREKIHPASSPGLRVVTGFLFGRLRKHPSGLPAEARSRDWVFGVGREKSSHEHI